MAEISIFHFHHTIHRPATFRPFLATLQSWRLRRTCRSEDGFNEHLFQRALSPFLAHNGERNGDMNIPLYNRLAITAGEALAMSILISLNLRWIAQIRRSLRKRLTAPR